jgi:2-polyprenyl-6-methoxyphenol hydroxylase-like FAD-dependent oxidoreductase
MPSMHRAPSAVAPSLSGSSSTQPDCDVALVGGGVIGLAAALALSRCGYRVQVLERGDWPALPSQGDASEVWDSRVLALSPASLRLLEALGVLAQLDSARCAPVYAMQISGDDALLTAAQAIKAEHGRPVRIHSFRDGPALDAIAAEIRRT